MRGTYEVTVARRGLREINADAEPWAATATFGRKKKRRLVAVQFGATRSTALDRAMLEVDRDRERWLPIMVRLGE